MVWTATVTALLMKVVLHALTQMGTVVVMRELCVQADQSPNLPEVCGDGVDNNCDGQADEGCSVICDLNDPACGQPGGGFAPDPEPSDDGCAQTVDQDIVPGLPAC